MFARETTRKAAACHDVQRSRSEKHAGITTVTTARHWNLSRHPPAARPNPASYDCRAGAALIKSWNTLRAVRRYWREPRGYCTVTASEGHIQSIKKLRNDRAQVCFKSNSWISLSPEEIGDISSSSVSLKHVLSPPGITVVPCMGGTRRQYRQSSDSQVSRIDTFPLQWARYGEQTRSHK
ncbi:hypothetical protein Bbelb_306600 [Branchiostoma belcheri]|nr:hypothetical protein Bbelb_306600 [Branchiostoma belcheri]